MVTWWQKHFVNQSRYQVHQRSVLIIMYKNSPTYRTYIICTVWTSARILIKALERLVMLIRFYVLANTSFSLTNKLNRVIFTLRSSIPQRKRFIFSHSLCAMQSLFSWAGVMLSMEQKKKKIEWEISLSVNSARSINNSK